MTADTHGAHAMTDDVRAAAERLRRWLAAGCVLGAHTYGTRDELGADVARVLPPGDDPTPLTPAVLRAVGFADSTVYGGCLRIKGVRRNGVGPWLYCLPECDAAWRWQYGDEHLPDPATLGGLVRLAACLGIELKETP